MSLSDRKQRCNNFAYRHNATWGEHSLGTGVTGEQSVTALSISTRTVSLKHLARLNNLQQWILQSVVPQISMPTDIKSDTPMSPTARGVPHDLSYDVSIKLQTKA